MNTLNSFLKGVMPIGIRALFANAVAYNAMFFAFLTQSESVFACCFMLAASSLVTFIGFSLFKYAELTESLSQQVAKDLQMSAAMDFRRRMNRRCVLQVGSNEAADGGACSIMYCQSSISGFKRNFRRMPLRMQVGPFGTITTGHSVEWVQQIIDNTVSAIFMVTVMGRRMLF